ncbi:hypothetical protein ACTMTJ_08125 [Phytohabitans sp. LJ34]
MIGGLLVGLTAVLAFGGPAAASGTLTRAGDHAVTAEAPGPAPAQRAAQEGEWRYSDFYLTAFWCEQDRGLMAAFFETDGCYYASGLGYYFWYYVP